MHSFACFRLSIEWLTVCHWSTWMKYLRMCNTYSTLPSFVNLVFFLLKFILSLFLGVLRSIHDRYHPKQENKIKCIIHYFERICSSTPSNFVSFERKVLSTNHNPSVVALPSYDLWANSVAPLCEFKVQVWDWITLIYSSNFLEIPIMSKVLCSDPSYEKVKWLIPSC